MKISISNLVDRFKFLFSNKCPKCGQVLPKVVRKPIKVFNSNDTALRLDQQRKAEQEAKEQELPHPIE